MNRDKIRIVYDNGGNRYWTGNSVKELTINGTPIYGAHTFDLSIGVNNITRVTLSILVADIEINPIEGVIESK